MAMVLIRRETLFSHRELMEMSEITTQRATQGESVASTTGIETAEQTRDGAFPQEQSENPSESTSTSFAMEPERFIAVTAHLIPLLNFVLPVLLPLALLMLLEIFFRRNRFLAQHIEQALAFQFFYFMVALAVLSVFLGQVHCLALAPFLALYGIASNVRGARAALRGEAYRYPLTWRLVARE